jgi:hypothetical protein
MDRNRVPVPRFFSSDASVNLDNTFKNNLVLEDTVGIGRVRIEAALHHQMSQFHWVARIFDDSWYLIEAPNNRWLQQAAARGTLHIEKVDIPVQRWDPAIDKGLRLRLVWVLVRGFPTSVGPVSLSHMDRCLRWTQLQLTI